MDLGGDNKSGAAETRPVLIAFNTFKSSLGEFVKAVHDGGLDDLDSTELVPFLQVFEQQRNRITLIDHALINLPDQRDLPQLLCQGSMRRVLTTALRISKGEAAAGPGRRGGRAAGRPARPAIGSGPVAPR